VVLNPYYNPEMNDFRYGTAMYPYAGLETGMHTMTIRAWDMFNNSSERSINFFVFEESGIHVTDVYAFPNPVTEGTTFTFSPEPGNGAMDVSIGIFSVTGKQVKEISVAVPENNGQPVRVYWDGSGQNGGRLPAGIYPFTVSFSGAAGTYSRTSGKVIIF